MDNYSEEFLIDNGWTEQENGLWRHTDTDEEEYTTEEAYAMTGVDYE